MGFFLERLAKFCCFSQQMESKKLRLSERGTNEFRNFGVMSVGKTKILLKKWKRTTHIPGRNYLARQ